MSLGENLRLNPGLNLTIFGGTGLELLMHGVMLNDTVLNRNLHQVTL